MCGRYTLRSTGVELQNELGLDEPPMLSARYNIAPTQAALVVTDAAPRTVTVAQWGLIPHWAKDPSIAHRLLNARSEGIQTSRAFKGALEQRRCLVVADGFYEWKHHGKTRTPSFITLQSGRPFTFAGLWETFSAPGGADVTSFTIITTEANQFMSTLHERMPVILGREAPRTVAAARCRGAKAAVAARAVAGRAAERHRGLAPRELGGSRRPRVHRAGDPSAALFAVGWRPT